MHSNDYHNIKSSGGVSTIQGNYCSTAGNNYEDIYVTGPDTSITGNVTNGGSRAEHGIRLDNADRSIVSGNLCISHATAGIGVDADVSGAHIVWNYLENESIASISDSGSSTTVVNADTNAIDFVSADLTTTGTVDLGGGTLEVPNGTTIPASCNVGEVFADTDSDDCANTGGGDGCLCICKSSNTWAVIQNY